ncbi:MAG: hypothetical protein WC158_03085 [Candidatus Paceibacterota bacterium]
MNKIRNNIKIILITISVFLIFLFSGNFDQILKEGIFFPNFKIFFPVYGQEESIFSSDLFLSIPSINNISCLIADEDKICPPYKNIDFKVYQDLVSSKIDTISYYKNMALKEEKDLSQSIKAIEAKIAWIFEITERIQSYIEEQEEGFEETQPAVLLGEFLEVLRKEREFKEKEKQTKVNILPLLESLSSSTSSALEPLKNILNFSKRCYTDSSSICYSSCESNCEEGTTENFNCFYSGDCTGGNPCQYAIPEMENQVQSLNPIWNDIAGERCQETVYNVRIHKDIKEYFNAYIITSPSLYYDIRPYSRYISFPINEDVCGKLRLLCEKYPDAGFCQIYPFEEENFINFCLLYPNESFCKIGLPPYFPYNVPSKLRSACIETINSWFICNPYPVDAVNFFDVDDSDLWQGVHPTSGPYGGICGKYLSAKFCSYPDDFQTRCGISPLYEYSNVCKYPFREFEKCGFEYFYYSEKCSIPDNPRSIMANAVKKKDPCLVCNQYSYNYLNNLRLNTIYGGSSLWLGGIFGEECEAVRFLCETLSDPNGNFQEDTTNRDFYNQYIADLCVQYPFNGFTKSQCRNVYSLIHNRIKNPFQGFQTFYSEQAGFRLLYESFCWLSYYDKKCHEREIEEIVEELEGGGKTGEILKEVKKLGFNCKFEELKHLYYTKTEEFCTKCEELSNEFEICKKTDDYVYLRTKCESICQN